MTEEHDAEGARQAAAAQLPPENRDFLGTPTTDVECPKCHRRDAKYTQIQDQHADEAPRTYYMCMRCAKGWRV